jgi:hypothetical protein
MDTRTGPLASRAAGIALLVYGVGTTVGGLWSGSPGGDYEDSLVTSYIRQGHWVPAFALWYLCALSGLALLVLGSRLRRTGDWLGDVLWGLAVAGSAVCIAGSFVSGGLEVAMAEGGHAVQTGVPHPVVYTITEIGNLIAVCGPALTVGVGAILVAARLPLPRGWRVVTVLAGVCGVLAPLFFTLFAYVLWTIAAGLAMIVAASRAERRTAAGPAASLV